MSVIAFGALRGLNLLGELDHIKLSSGPADVAVHALRDVVVVVAAVAEAFIQVLKVPESLLFGVADDLHQRALGILGEVLALNGVVVNLFDAVGVRASLLSAGDFFEEGEAKLVQDLLGSRERLNRGSLYRFDVEGHERLNRGSLYRFDIEGHERLSKGSLGRRLGDTLGLTRRSVARPGGRLAQGSGGKPGDRFA